MNKRAFAAILWFALTLLVTFGFGNAADARPPGRREYGVGGRLVIWRVPGLGNDLVVAVSIDGQRVADLTYGRHLDTTVAPGQHVITVEAYPRPFDHRTYSTAINVRPGELYNFTAKGGTENLHLTRS
jgi:hypothetical protein